VALVAVGFLADVALRRQARAEERAVRADARGRARLLSASVRAELARVEEAVAGGGAWAGVESLRLRLPPAASVAFFARPGFAERERAELALAVGSLEATQAGLPEAVVAALALGGEEPRQTAAERLLEGRLPVRAGDLPHLAAQLGVGSDARVEALAGLLGELEAAGELQALPAFDRRLAETRLVGWSRSETEALRYSLGLDSLAESSALPVGASLEALAEASARGRLLVDVEGVDGLVLSVPLAALPSALPVRLGLWALVGLLGLVALYSMRSLNREQAALDRERDFLTTVSHEMRTPLASVRVLGETLAEGRGDAKEYGVLIARESLRLSDLIEGVLAAARAGEAPQLEDVEPERLLRDAAALIRPRAEKRDVAFDVDVSDLPAARWDGEAVRRAVLGLLDNALRHGCRDGGRFELRASAADGAIRIEVADDGPGIGRADARRVRGRFERAGETGGTGLGLWLVEQVAAAHGGRLELETEPGQGARFVLHLPVKPPQEDEAGLAAEAVPDAEEPA